MEFIRRKKSPILLFVVAIFILVSTLSFSPDPKTNKAQAAGGWSALAAGANGTVNASVVYGSELYIAGDFTSPGNKIGKWNGASWSTVGVPNIGAIRALTVFGTDLWAGGDSGTAKWDGASWTNTSTGLGTYTTIYALSVYNGVLYAGKDKGMRVWNGTSSAWEYVGTNYPTDTVASLAVFNGELYAGGWFTGLNGGGTGNRLAKWNGSTWIMVGYGFDNAVLSLEVYNSQLYAGGYFNNACLNNSCSSKTATVLLSKLNGSTWEETGASPNHGVTSMAVYNNKLYIGGRFTALGVIANTGHVGRYDGASWEAVGTGIAGDNTVYVNTLMPYGADIVAGGTFTTAGGNAANRVARWNDGGVTISGNVYTAEDKSTNIGADKTVGLSVNGGPKTTIETTAGGAFSFSDVTVGAGYPIALFVDGETDLHANYVTLALDASTAITAIEMYTDKIVLSHASAGPISNANLATAATQVDDDFMFSSDGTNATFNAGYQAYVATAKTYTPGGIITAHDLRVAGTGTLNSSDKAMNFSGSALVDTGATVTSTGVVTFNAASGTETLDMGGTSTAHDLQILTKSGGGTLQLIDHGLDVDGTLTVSASTTMDTNNQPLSAGTLSNLGILKMTGGETTAITTKDTTHGTVEYTGVGTYSALPFGNAYYNIIISGNGSFTPDGDVAIGGTFTQTAGTVNLGNRTFACLGNFTVSGGVFNGATSNITLDATGASIILDAPSAIFNNLTIKTGVTIADTRKVIFTAGDYVIGGNLNIISDVSPITLDAASNNPNISITGNLISSGAGYGQRIMAGSGNWTVDGNIDLTDCTFEGNSSSFIWRAQGNDTPSITANDQTFYNFEIGSAKTYTLNDAFRTSGTFKDTVGGSTLKFKAGLTYRITAINISGQIGSLVTLQSSNTGTRWNFYVSQTNPTVSYVSVRDSNASNKTIIATNGTNTDAGNNLNWTFPTTPTPTPSPSPASSSTSSGEVVIDNSSSDDPTLPAASPTASPIDVATGSPDMTSSVASAQTNKLVEIPAVTYRDQVVVLQGKALPGAVIKVTIDNEIIETTADSNGLWKIELNKEPGTYKAQVVAYNPDGTQETQDVEIKVLSYSQADLRIRYIAVGFTLIAALVAYLLIRKKSNKKKTK